MDSNSPEGQSKDLDDPIYKVMSASDFAELQKTDQYIGSAHDQRDGFIHFSTLLQLPGTLAKHYAHQDDLVLLAVSTDTLGTALRWEKSRNDDLFPHVYGPMDTTRFKMLGAITWDGSLHQLPPV